MVVLANTRRPYNCCKIVVVVVVVVVVQKYFFREFPQKTTATRTSADGLELKMQ